MIKDTKVLAKVPVQFTDRAGYFDAWEQAELTVGMRGLANAFLLTVINEEEREVLPKFERFDITVSSELGLNSIWGFAKSLGGGGLSVVFDMKRRLTRGNYTEKKITIARQFPLIHPDGRIVVTRTQGGQVAPSEGVGIYYGKGCEFGVEFLGGGAGPHHSKEMHFHDDAGIVYHGPEAAVNAWLREIIPGIKTSRLQKDPYYTREVRRAIAAYVFKPTRRDVLDISGVQEVLED